MINIKITHKDNEDFILKSDIEESDLNLFQTIVEKGGVLFNDGSGPVMSFVVTEEDDRYLINMSE